MTSYLPNTSNDVGNILYPSTSETHASQAKRGVNGLMPLDTVVSAAQAQGKQATSLDRPALPPSNPKVAVDQLMIIVAAFCKAYSAMNQSVIAGVDSLTKLQDLDQTQAEIILRKSTEAINKQEALVKEQAELQEYQAKASGIETILNWTMFAAGIVLMIGAAVFTGGAAAAVVPEEFELLEMAGGAAEGAEDLEAGVSSLGDLSGVENEASAVDGGSHDLDGLTTSDAKSESWGQIFKRFGLKVGIASGLSSPLLVKWGFGLQIADRLHALSASQLTVGDALATVSRNNMYFQFLQQLMQREAGVTNEEVKNASEVIDTFASLTSGIRGISYGLSQSA